MRVPTGATGPACTTCPCPATDDVAAMLRAEAGRNPYDKKLTELIGELSTRSEVFRQRWADHNVRYHRTGAKRLHHPAVGALELHFEAMTLTSDPGLTLLVYTAAPDSPSADSLRLLASWAATQENQGSSERTARGWALFLGTVPGSCAEPGGEPLPSGWAPRTSAQ